MTDMSSPEAEIERLRTENAELEEKLRLARTMGGHFRSIIIRLIRDGALGDELRAASDAELAERGLDEGDIALLRGLLDPIENFSWVIEGEVAGSAFPRTQAAVEALAAAGIRRVVTLCPRTIPSEWLEGAGLESVQIPMPDFRAPTLEDLASAVDAVRTAVEERVPVVVHCMAGRGRTGTVLAAYLAERMGSDDAGVAEIRRLRPDSIDSTAQADTVRAYFAARGGATGGRTR
jgi:atypical dual specificity phosphatase